MDSKRRFPNSILSPIRDGSILRIRAGREPHRFIGIWAVVVENRVFVRSWSLKPRSWYRTFLEDPVGAIQVAGREIPVRAVQTRSERLKDAVDHAYLEKYRTPGSIRYARDLGREKSRATTTELQPFSSKASGRSRSVGGGGKSGDDSRTAGAADSRSRRRRSRPAGSRRRRASRPA